MDFKLNKSNLNFRVYTASALPSTAQENDICIISDVPMKNWILSPNAPSGAPRTDGDVWIRYSVTGNTFSVLKSGYMMIATIRASQYVDGAWVSKEVRSYHNGAWGRYLFRAGSGAITEPTVSKASGTTVTITADSIVKTGTGSNSDQWASIKFEGIDLTYCNAVYFDVTCTNKGASTLYANQYVKDTSVRTYWEANKQRTIYKCDVTSLSGTYTIGCSGDGAAYTIHNIWLE